MSETTNKAAPTTDVGSAAATTSGMHWPEAMVALGLWLTMDTYTHIFPAETDDSKKLASAERALFAPTS